MDLTKGKEKAGEFLNKSGEKLKALPEAVGKLCATLRRSSAGRTPPDGVSGERGFTPAKRRIILFVLGGVLALLFILLIATLAVNSRRPKGNAVANMTAGPVIPSDELFIPSEPDFLPKFLPEREPRRSWSLEDIRPYWKNPGNPETSAGVLQDPGSPSDPWRREIKTAVDKLMEAVP